MATYVFSGSSIICGDSLKLPFCAVEFAFASAVDMWEPSWGLLQGSGLEFSWSPQGTGYRLNRDHQILVKGVNEHMPLLIP